MHDIIRIVTGTNKHSSSIINHLDAIKRLFTDKNGSRFFHLKNLSQTQTVAFAISKATPVIVAPLRDLKPQGLGV